MLRLMSSGAPSVSAPGAAAHPRRPPGDLGLVLILGLLAALGPLAIDMYLPAFPAIQRDLGADASAVQLTLAIYFAGLCIGQLVVGPLSDAVGRVRPLRVGLALFVAGCAAGAAAPSTELLIAARLIQALGGSACMVVTRAVVRDVRRGADAARMLSQLVLVMGVAPILAPLAGGALLAAAGWRAIFGVVAAVAALALLVVWIALPETAPPRRPAPHGGRLRALLSDRHFVRYAAAAALASAGMFAYITSASFVFITLHRVSPGHFGWFFGANAAGFILASQVNARLVGRHPPARIFARALVVSVAASLWLVAAAVTGIGGLWATAAGLFVFLATVGFLMPNATALALEHQGERAGIAAAWLGAVQFALAASASALVSALHDGTARPMTVIIAACGVGALVVQFLLGRPGRAAA